MDHVGHVGSGALTSPVQQVLAAFHDLATGGERAVLGGGSDLIDPQSGGAEGVDCDLGDDQVAVEEIFVLADGGDAAESHQVAATGQGALPETFLCQGIVERLPVLAGGSAIGVGSVLGSGEQGHDEESEDGQCFHDRILGLSPTILGLDPGASKDRLGDNPCSSRL